jgi:MFS family permease
VTILLPSISKDVDAPVAQLQWAVTGYSLVGAAVIVTAGALGDVLGRRKVFLAGLALFIASCAFIALSTTGAGVVIGRMIQGASGATILAGGMSLLSVASSGSGQMKAVEESRDPNRSRSIDFAGTVLIALLLAPVVLALSKGNDWGWASAATLGCFALSIVAGVLFVIVEKRVQAPIVHLSLLRNRVLVGATLAILSVAGTINALMYVLSLYFQDPSALGMSAFEAGLATLPAAAGMIAITPLITPLAVKVGAARAVVVGFLLAAGGFAVLAFVEASWATRRSSARWWRSRSASASRTGPRRRARPPRWRPTRSARRRGSRTWPATSAARSPSPRSR